MSLFLLLEEAQQQGPVQVTSMFQIIDTGLVKFGLRPFATMGVLAVTSQQSGGYDASLVNDSDLDTCWRTSATGTQSITLQASADFTEDHLIWIFGSNFRDCTIDAALNSDPSFSSPLSFGTLELQKNVRSNMRAGWLRLPGLATRRLIRVSIPSQTPDAGVSYYQIRMIAVVPYSNLIQQTISIQLPWPISLFRPSKINLFDVGGRGVVNLGRRRHRFELGSQGTPASDEENIFKMQMMDEDQSFLFIESLRMPSNDTRITDTSRSYLVKRIGDFSTQFTGDPFEFSIILEEQ